MNRVDEKGRHILEEYFKGREATCQPTGGLWKENARTRAHYFSLGLIARAKAHYFLVAVNRVVEHGTRGVF